jgi:hypothetical protein
MPYARKDVLKCPHAATPKLDALVEGFIRDAVTYIGVVGSCGTSFPKADTERLRSAQLRTCFGRLVGKKRALPALLIPAVTHARPGHIPLKHDTEFFRLLGSIIVDDGVPIGRDNGLHGPGELHRDGR